MVTVKFNHAVIYHGNYYPANTEIETKEPTEAKIEKDEAVIEQSEPVSEPKVEQKRKPVKKAGAKNDDGAGKES